MREKKKKDIMLIVLGPFMVIYLHIHLYIESRVLDENNFLKKKIIKLVWKPN